MHILQTYRAALRDPLARGSFTANLIGRIPESVVSVALLLIARQSTGSWQLGGLVAAAFGLGSALGAPLAGKAIDRHGQRLVLPAMSLAFAALLVGVVAAADRQMAVPLVVLASLGGLARPPLETAMRSLWPQLAGPERLDAAYALDAALQELVWIAGPLLLSATLVLAGPAAALLGCAVVSAVATLLYSVRAGRVGRGRPTDVAAAPIRSIRFAELMAAACLYGAAAGVLVVALTAFCQARGGGPLVGVAIAIWAAGSLLGGIVYGTFAASVSPERRAALLLGALALGLALLTPTRSLGLLLGLMFLLGLPLSPWLAALSSAVQTAVPTGRATEAFGWTYGLITTGIAIGNGAAGLMLEPIGPSLEFLLAAALVVAALGVLVPSALRSPACDSPGDRVRPFPIDRPRPEDHAVPQ